MHAQPIDWMNCLFNILNTAHMKCDIEQDIYCAAEQYGDGNSDEHSSLRELAEDIAELTEFSKE